MNLLGFSLGTIANADWKPETKKAEKKEVQAPKHQNAPTPPDKQKKDSYTGSKTHILDEGYSTNKANGTAGFNGPMDGNSSKLNGSVIDLDSTKDPGKKDDHWSFDNRDGMKNVRRVVKTDKFDTVKFQGDGWTKKENVTDEQSLKDHQKDPKNKVLTGTLYEDKNGNKVLVTGKGKQDMGAQLNSVSN
jgi:hypothetical protein